MARRGPGSKGRLVVLVGPDGVGKTTVARCLADQIQGPVTYFHFRPPILSALPTRPPDSQAPSPGKHVGRGSRVLGWARLGRNLVRFWVGYLLRIRPQLRLGGTVIADRWAYGYLVQPAPLKYFGPLRLARLALRLMPQPDLVANLAASPETIHTRKRELSMEAIQAELDLWERLPGPVKTYDAEQPPQDVAAAIIEDLCQ